MPLNAKGKKILASMEKKYGKKKGKTVFYAMENSGKLKRIKQLGKGGNTGYSDYASPSSSTASQDFGTQAVSGGQTDYGAMEVTTSKLQDLKQQLQKIQEVEVVDLV
jgi:hypothetical protein